MRVIVRAYTADGYHKDILVMDEQQVRMNENRIEQAELTSSVEGIAAGILPAMFPEMVRFDVIVQR